MTRTVLVEHARAAYITGLTHRFQLMTETRPRPLPTVVLVHGRHGTEEVPFVFSRTLPKSWLVVSPRAIEFDPEFPDGEDGYSWIFQPQDRWPDLDDFDAAVTALGDFIEALPDAYGADPDNIFLLGFSQGAAAAYATAIDRPGLIQGIAGLVGFAPIVPSGISSQLPLRGMPIHMSVGKTDTRVPLNIAHACRETLTTAGADLDYHEYQIGHKLNSQGIRDLTAWWEAREAEVNA